MGFFSKLLAVSEENGRLRAENESLRRQLSEALEERNLLADRLAGPEGNLARQWQNFWDYTGKPQPELGGEG